jgi:hypothetical protein
MLGNTFRYRQEVARPHRHAVRLDCQNHGLYNQLCLHERSNTCENLPYSTLNTTQPESDSSEHPIVEAKDWRLQATSTLRFINGLPAADGAHVSVVAQTMYGRKRLTFEMPNVTALFLDYSKQLWDETAIGIREEHLLGTDAVPKGASQHFEPADQSRFYVLLEKRMASIIFACNALECFANEQLPADFTYTRQNRDGVEENLSKTDVERRVGLSEKLDAILPKIFGIRFNKGGKMWENFLLLKQIRDRITHLKTQDRKSVQHSEKTLWTDLVNPNLPDFPQASVKLIKFYFDKSKQSYPRWLRKWPYS